MFNIFIVSAIFLITLFLFGAEKGCMGPLDPRDDETEIPLPEDDNKEKVE